MFRKILKRVKWTILLCIIFVLLLYAGMVLLLDGMNIIDSEQTESMNNSSSSDSSSNNLNTTVSDENLQNLMKKSDEEVWALLTDNKFKKKPTLSQMPRSQMNDVITTIQVTVRTESGDLQAGVRVNKALADLFKAFFQDLYEYCPDFYVLISESYNFKNKSNGEASSHAFGAAVDINAEYNPIGREPYTAEEYANLGDKEKHYVIYKDSKMVKIAKKYSLAWGGLWSGKKDNKHFSFIGDWSRTKTIQQYGS